MEKRKNKQGARQLDDRERLRKLLRLLHRPIRPRKNQKPQSKGCSLRSAGDGKKRGSGDCFDRNKPGSIPTFFNGSYKRTGKDKRTSAHPLKFYRTNVCDR